MPPSAELAKAETFGPVVSVYPYGDISEAIELANDSAYGLSASIWGPAKLAEQIAGQIRCGTVNINDGHAASWASMAAPMGGMGISGLGRRHGAAGILKYTEPCSVVRSKVLPLQTPKFLSNGQFANLTSTFARFMRHFS